MILGKQREVSSVFFSNNQTSRLFSLLMKEIVQMVVHHCPLYMLLSTVVNCAPLRLRKDWQSKFPGAG